ncbi:MAG: hypothetical protein K6G28_06060 [Acholeplasmatales bacterium]|nr:hypothetical protein [Acholeplasmatales bacterium]
MSLVDIVDKTPKKNIANEKGLINCVKFYNSVNYEQLKYNLIYAKDDEVANKDDVHVYARVHKDTLFKFVLAESLKELESFDFSNETLKKNALNRTLEHLESNAFDLARQVTIIVINDTKVDQNFVKRYAFLNTKYTKQTYQVVFRFDNTNVVVKQYRTLPNTIKIYNMFNTALKFDLGCTNPKGEE